MFAFDILSAVQRADVAQLVEQPIRNPPPKRWPFFLFSLKQNHLPHLSAEKLLGRKVQLLPLSGKEIQSAVN